MARIHQIYQLHRILKGRRYPASKQFLMESLEVSHSTFHRVRAQLEAMGAPIINKRGQGYCYDPEADAFELPGLFFSARELEALLAIYQLLRNIPAGSLQEQIAPLQNRITTLLNQAVPEKAEFPGHRIRILPVHPDQSAPRYLNIVVSAVVERRQCAFTYLAGSSGKKTQRRVSPQHAVYYRDKWYMDCWDEDKQALRTFSVGRMSKVKMLNDPAREIDKEFLEQHFQSGYGLFSGQVVGKAKLLFTPERAYWVANETWHPDQSHHIREDGSYELTVPYSDTRELLSEILRHGPEVRVLAPRSLAKMAQKQLRQAVNNYADIEKSR